jgi:hypothetical protein
VHKDLGKAVATDKLTRCRVVRLRVVTTCCHTLATPALPLFLYASSPSPILKLSRPNTSVSVNVTVSAVLYNGTTNCTAAGVGELELGGSPSSTPQLSVSPWRTFNFSSGECEGWLW